ncbi:thioredoxin family protein [Aureitalea sp. L0-47]|nr:thioredoxin family protein [Aureitalea sp. L0-47]
MELTDRKKLDLVKEKLEEAIDYNTYISEVARLAEEGLSTSPEQTESNSQYTKLNNARMHRWDKKLNIPQDVAQKFRSYKGKVTWLVITESWCGDAAHALPVMNKLAELSEGIDLKIVYRDTHPDLMDEFLTNGARSIPKLIALDEQKDEIIGEWGSRPTEATKMVADYKSEHGMLTEQFKKDLQVWYNKDKGQNIIKDLTALV